METAWIQVFLLTMSECVAPAGKTVCQEQDVELQFLTQADCQAGDVCGDIAQGAEGLSLSKFEAVRIEVRRQNRA